MKTRTIIFALLLALGIFASACSQHTCPAYTQKPAQTTQKAG